MKAEFNWWKHGIIYHIYVRSFYDSNNDGIGDIQGVIQKLDYLSKLGIHAILLSPVFESPMIDFGYDVSDYRKISPDYGTMEDMGNLIMKAHHHGIKVIIDMVLNHTSEQHPWFLESRSSLDNPKRNWYIWKDGRNGKCPNNWTSAVGTAAWSFDEKTKQYYLHSFFKEQPDLNWRNEEMIDAMFGEVKFWLDMGIDGFRLDVINFIAKDKKFRNNPVFMGIKLFQTPRYNRNRPRSFKIIKKLRKLVESYGNKILIGEIYVMPPGNSAIVACYLDNEENKGLHLAFDFSLIFKRWSAKSYYSCMNNVYQQLSASGWPCIVLSNHDLSRSYNRFFVGNNKIDKAKIAAVFLFTVKGTPFIYYGEEMGMSNGDIGKNEIKDPLGKKFWPFYKGRDKARTPMQWNSEIFAGFSKVKPWLPVNGDYLLKNVELQKTQENSIFNVFKTLIQLRNESMVLQQGDWQVYKKGNDGILSYYRTLDNERLLIVLNFKNAVKNLTLDKNYSYEIIFTIKQTDVLIQNNKIKVAPLNAIIYKLNPIKL